jgi:hypothetical protein
MRGLRAFLVASVLTVSSAWSADAAAQQKAAAEALFRSGREAAAKGDWLTACDRFAASNRLDSTPGTILNLARCREELGQLASAWQYYQEAAQKLPPTDRRHALAVERAEALSARLPRVTLVLASSPEGTTVEQNGAPLDTNVLGVPLPVDPGVQKVVVRAPGHEDWTLEFEVREGEQVEKTLQLGALATPRERHESGARVPVEAAGAQGDAASSAPDDSSRTWGYVATGVGVVGIGVGAVTGLLAIDAMHEVENAGCSGRYCDSEGVAAAERGSKMATASTIGFAVGAASLGVGIYLLLFEGEDGGGVKAGVTPTAGGATLAIGGTL